MRIFTLCAALFLPALGAQAAVDSAGLVLGQQAFTTAINRIEIASFTMSGAAAAAFSSDRVYVADTDNSRVLWWNSASAYHSGRGADGVLGQADFTSSDPNMGLAAPTAATLSSPTGVAVDGDGNVWVVDNGNFRVLKYAKPTGNGSDATLVLGQADFISSTFGCLRNRFVNPYGIAVSGAKVVVSDKSGGRILVFNSPATNGDADRVLGREDFITCAGFDSGDNKLSDPLGVAVDSNDRIWVADYSDNRVLGFPTGSSHADRVLGQTNFVSYGSNTSQTGLSHPKGVFVDASLNIWVADTSNNRVLKYAYPGAGEPGKAASLLIGQTSYTGHSFDVSSNTLNEPAGLAVDAEGNVWVADAGSSRVVRYDAPSANTPSAAFVLGQFSMTTADTYVITGQMLYKPAGVVEGDGRIYVADSDNNRVLWWNSSAAYVNGRTAEGVLGQADLYNHLCNRENPKGRYVSRRNADTLCSPLGVAVDAAGNVWVADSGNDRVLKYARPTASGQNAILVIGQVSFTASASGVSQTNLSEPSDVKVAASGDVWVADSANNRVLKFTAPAGNNPSASLVLGQTGFGTNSSACGTAGLNTPYALALGPARVIDTSKKSVSKPGSVSAENSVWVADMQNNRVVMYGSPSSDGEPANLAIGQTALDSCATPSTVGASTLTGPAGVYVDKDSAVWVTDTSSHRLLKFGSPSASGASASLVLGQSDMTGSSANRGAASPAANTLNGPAGVFVNAFGNPWVADLYNNRVLKYLLSPESYSISGIVTRDSVAMASVTLTLAGTASGSATSAADGTYTFSNLTLGGGYTVTPSLAGYSFTPVSASTISLTANWTGNNFVAKIGYSISGQVLVNGIPEADVLVSLTGSASNVRAAVSSSTLTDAGGNYSFALLPGNYILTPTKAGYYFNPPQFAAALQNSNIISNFATAFVGDKPALVEGGVNGYVEPWKGPAKIRLTPRGSGHISIRIYTLRKARLIRTLEADVTAGNMSTILWDCLNTDGQTVGSGVYVVVINGAGYDNEKIKMGVLK